MRNVNDTKLEGVERLLRAAGSAQLDPGFRAGVLRAVGRLPDPDVIVRPSLARLLGPVEWSALCVVVLSLCALLVPAVRQWAIDAQLELSTLTLSFSVGDAALSASVLSVAALLLGGLFMAGVGVFGARHRLIGA
jgi:hypothetical protein